MSGEEKNLRLLFDTDALEEYRRLEKTHRKIFRKKLRKLATRREYPSPKNALHGFPRGYYKIKLRKAGMRLVYRYDDNELVILVIAVGRRERNTVYEVARARMERKL